MNRVGREERLAACRLELATGRTLKLGRLRSFCRPVIFCGSKEQVHTALVAAEPFKAELLRRGVFLVPLPLGDNAGEALPAVDKESAEAARYASSPSLPVYKSRLSGKAKQSRTTSEIYVLCRYLHCLGMVPRGETACGAGRLLSLQGSGGAHVAGWGKRP